jgi:hypothetical protein
LSPRSIIELLSPRSIIEVMSTIILL